MNITIELPDDIGQHADPGREALEAIAIEGYRSEKLTHYQASQLLGITRFEFDGFLKARGVYDHAYSPEDLEQDLATLRELESKGLLRRP
jgi:predicted HTH domain antitoxin